MISRRNFLARTAVVAMCAAVGVGTGVFHHAATKARVEPETATHYRVTCQEISDNEIQAVWLGENKVWSETLSEISWSIEDIDLVPDVGDVIQFDRTSGVSPDKKLGTLGFVGLKVVKFRARVISVEEIGSMTGDER